MEWVINANIAHSAREKFQLTIVPPSFDDDWYSKKAANPHNPNAPNCLTLLMPKKNDAKNQAVQIKEDGKTIERRTSGTELERDRRLPPPLDEGGGDTAISRFHSLYFLSKLQTLLSHLGFEKG